MATQIVPLAPAPFDQIMFTDKAMTTAWRTWFSQLWSYAKGPFLATAQAGTNSGVMNTTFFSDDSTLVSINLPLQFNVGDEFRVVGVGVGGWRITQNIGQTIHRPTGNTTTGVTGSVSSTNRYDSVTLVGIVKDSDLAVMFHEGVLTFA